MSYQMRNTGGVMWYPRIRLAIFAVLVLIASGVSVREWATKDRDPDHARVVQYLRENLDDPRFEEVRWWPAVRNDDRVKEAIDLCIRAMEASEPRTNTYSMAEKRLKECREPKRYARMRYRTRVGEGLVMRDTFFILRTDEIITHDMNKMWADMFPD